MAWHAGLCYAKMHPTLTDSALQLSTHRQKYTTLLGVIVECEIEQSRRDCRALLTDVGSVAYTTVSYTHLTLPTTPYV